MVQDVADRDERHVWHGGDGALRVRRVVVPRARHCISWRDEVDFSVDMFEAEEAAGDDGDDVLLVVDPGEIRDLVKVFRQISCREACMCALTLESNKLTYALLPTLGVP